MREAADRFDQVAVGIAIAGDHLAQCRNRGEGIGLVKTIEQRHIDVGKFQAQKPGAVLQDAARLGKRAVDSRHVADAEGDRIAIYGYVRYRQILVIAAEEAEAISAGWAVRV